MASRKLICLIIFFAFFTEGYGCDFDSLTLTQSKTGKMLQKKPEWEVKVTNPCTCVFLHTKLSCTGFKSVIPIESSVLAKPGPSDEACLLYNGNRLAGGDHFAFKYVWDIRYNFKINYTEIACS